MFSLLDPKQVIKAGNTHDDHQDFAFYGGIVYDANDGGIWYKWHGGWNSQNAGAAITSIVKNQPGTPFPRPRRLPVRVRSMMTPSPCVRK